MRLGMCGAFLPDDMNDLTAETCKRVREMGFSGIFARFMSNNPHTTPRAKAERVRKLMADENLRLFQIVGYRQNLVTTDENNRKESVLVRYPNLKLAYSEGQIGWFGSGAGAADPA